MHFAEFGVVMMLFLVGGTAATALFMAIARPDSGLGGLQVAVTTGRRHHQFHLWLSWQMRLAVGMILIIFQRRSCSKLSKKNIKPGGPVVFLSAVVSGHCRHPMVALLPLLAVKGGSSVTLAANRMIFVAAEQHSAAYRVQRSCLMIVTVGGIGKTVSGAPD